jgi:hypothetical protein
MNSTKQPSNLPLKLQPSPAHSTVRHRGDQEEEDQTDLKLDEPGPY